MKRRRFRFLSALTISAGVLSLLVVAPATAQDYFGSEECGSCHPSVYNDFRLSGHPYKLVRADEARVRPIPLPDGYEWSDISYVIGGFKWKSRYVDQNGYIITELGDGTPGMNQWNYLTRTWSDYHAGEVDKPYNCGRCHTTGWVADDDWETDDTLVDNQDGLPGMHGTFAFGGIQCEACHGPEAHFSPETFMKDGSNAFCGTCHVRSDPATIPASGGFIRHHEQYNEILASPHAELSDGCINCHDPHKQSASSIHTTCSDCHGEIADLYAGTEMEAVGVTCEDCHMSMATKSAVALGPYKGDVMTHLFTINTDASYNMFTSDGGLVALDADGQGAVTLDFACLSCHQNQTLRWAEIYGRNFHGTEGSTPGRDTPPPTRIPRVPIGNWR